MKLSRSRLHAYLWSKLASSPEEETAIQIVMKKDPELAKIRSLLSRFHKLMTDRESLAIFEKWIDAASQSGIDEFQQFSQYLRSDWAAVKNAFLYSWSNGLVEGHVNRIKVIKRQMYGRMSFDLLRQKVLFQTS
ncbi:transposase [Domibacillus indicus]|uniref:transposase n=1 Tax=Domibacillus indicus TaxID=1437523 RepID=UPI0037BEA30D